MKIVTVTLLFAGLAGAAGTDVDLYTPQELHRMTDQLSAKGAPFSSKDLKRYGSHYTMLAHREATGSSEVHEHESDIFFIVAGSAELLTGGKLVNAKTTKPGELRGTGIEGGTKQALPQGSVVHIPAGVPHQMLVSKGDPVTYFVVKVIEPDSSASR